MDDYFTVIAPLDGTPASRAGLEPGDRIIALDDEPLIGEKLIDVVERLRGKPGTDVTLSIWRESAPESFDVALTRAQIEVASVRGRLLEPDYGYIRISQFQSNTGEEFTRALRSLVEENGNDLNGLVLDLRKAMSSRVSRNRRISSKFTRLAGAARKPR